MSGIIRVAIDNPYTFTNTHLKEQFINLWGNAYHSV